MYGGASAGAWSLERFTGAVDGVVLNMVVPYTGNECLLPRSTSIPLPLPSILYRAPRKSNFM